MKSVKDWARLRGYEYEFMSESLGGLCGPEFVARVGDNICSIANLGRLEWTRKKLTEGYDQVIWLDADVFVFDPSTFVMAANGGYAFAREVWVNQAPDGRPRLYSTGLNNAAFLFTPRQCDLSLFIHIIRHTVMTRPVTANMRIGVRLVSGLANTLAIPVMTCVGNFSPDVINALAEDRGFFVAAFARMHGFPMQAANLCWSKRGDFTEDLMAKAMDRLEASRGEVLNRHLAPAAA